MDQNAKMGVSLHIHIYYDEKLRSRGVGLKAGLDPDGGRWRQIVAGGLDAMDQVNALFG